MTNAEQIAREIAEDFEVKEPGISELTEAIVRAMKQARTAGFNEAKERAVEIVTEEVETYSEGMSAVDQRFSFTRGPKWKDGKAIATALQAMKQGGSDD